MSYTIEVYRNNQRAERNLSTYALYVLFWPQLVAGPIERPQNILHQFYQKHAFDYQRVMDGLRLMAWGFFKKLVIADRIAVYVDHVYSNPGSFEGFPLLIAAYLFAFQIYCDFSGYSDIAIGAANVLGIRLMNNFNRPYSSESIAEFWRRWHISLSTWFRDYLYIPLGGNRVTQWRMYYNILIVFMISGLWHGAKWTFVIWGLLHGFYLVSSMATKDIRHRITGFIHLDRFPRVHKVFKIIVTFHLVTLAWVFFRANSVSDALLIFKNMLEISGFQIPRSIPIQTSELIFGFAFIVLLECIQLILGKENFPTWLNRKPPTIRWAAYVTLILIIEIFGMFGTSSQFIYFQF
jgi:D-alanyl-lipoteichoic acid acyltransferase DltB (MBOAT superfamily)